MSDYFFNKSSLIIIKNFLSGIILSLPLLFSGMIKNLMFVILLLFVGKYFYKLYKRNEIKVPLIILLCIPLSGVFTGLCLGIIGIALYYNIVFEVSQLLSNLIITTLIVLTGGIYLAFRLGAYK